VLAAGWLLAGLVVGGCAPIQPAATSPDGGVDPVDPVGTVDLRDPRSWEHQVQFAYTEAEPPLATELGLTIAGLWTEAGPAEERATGRLAGDIAFLLAAWGDVIEEAREAGFDLAAAASRDIFGNAAVPSWYVEDHGMPDTITLSINSPIFFEYLKDQARWAVDNLDFLLVDESLTNIGLIGLEPRDAGFGPDDIRMYEEQLGDTLGTSFRAHLVAAHGFPPLTDADLMALFGVASLDDFNIAALLRKDPAQAGSIGAALRQTQASVYEEYVAFQQVHAYERVNEYLDFVRQYARDRGSSLKIGANTGLGNFADWTPLVSPLWRDRLDFTVSELTPYNFEMLPAGKLLPELRLARAISAGRPFGLMSVTFSTTLNGLMTGNGARLTTMNTVYFFEGLANRGNFALGWAEGPQAYISSHDYVKPLVEFGKRRRPLYDFVPARHRIAVLFGNEAVLADPTKYASYLGLALGLAELGYQFDVIHAGDARFNELPIDEEAAAAYAVILVPMANSFTAAQRAALARLAARGVELVFFALADEALRPVGVTVPEDVGRAYADDRNPEHLAPLTAALAAHPSDVTGTAPGVIATIDRRADGPVAVIHLLNYNYDRVTDEVAASGPMTLRLESPSGAAGGLTAAYVRPGAPTAELPLTSIADGRVEVTVPDLGIYGALVIGQADWVRAMAR
jgi:hypothetical protein